MRRERYYSRVTNRPSCVPPTDHAIEIDPSKISAVQPALLTWFEANALDLPWRRTRDPYRILVSEVMLQQIQVARAIPFYEAFLARFPTVAALAEAPRSEVIRTWGDLGRYRRAANLHRAAQIIVAEHDGQIPNDVETLRRLPGIGPYTAGAIVCFAFEQDVAFVDTNVRRVLHRLFVGIDVPTANVSDRALLEIAEAIVPDGRGWCWNQALMEFGALRCRARKPACSDCPVRDSCCARPAIGEALTAQPRQPRSTLPANNEWPNRLYRGRVLAALRELPTDHGDNGIELRSLGTRVRDAFTDADLPSLYRVVRSLTDDGLAVAEERPVYDAGDAEAPDLEVRVKLP
jgi:A/G-specific adenine glycosylase